MSIHPFICSRFPDVDSRRTVLRLKKKKKAKMSGKEDETLSNDNASPSAEDSPEAAVDSEATTPVTTPRKKSGVPSGLMGSPVASPARSSAVTIVGGGKRQRMGSGSGHSASAAASGPFGALGAVPPSPPKFASLEEIVSASTGVKNMVRAVGRKC